MVVKPPAGLNVTYLPDGYETKSTKDATLYKVGNITFKPVFVLGVLVYQVVGPSRRARAPQARRASGGLFRCAPADAGRRGLTGGSPRAVDGVANRGDER